MSERICTCCAASDPNKCSQPKILTCSTCDGSGVIATTIKDNEGQPVEDRCPTCNPRQMFTVPSPPDVVPKFRVEKVYSEGRVYVMSQHGVQIEILVTDDGLQVDLTKGNMTIESTVVKMVNGEPQLVKDDLEA